MGGTGSFVEDILKLLRIWHLPKITIPGIIEIIILTFIFYYIVKNIRGTRAWLLLKGVITLACLYIVAYICQFSVILVIFQNLMLFFGIAIIVIIQPDLRKILESLGNKEINVTLKSIITSVFKSKHSSYEVTKRISDKTVQELVKGCAIMGKAKTGALIVIEGDIPLNEYVESGIKVNADITSQLLINIFEKNTPLHDGAVIIQKDRVSAATCYLPLSNSNKINKDLGTRHRAGIGITEQTDCCVLIVSEETGAISLAQGGKLYHNIDRDRLVELLTNIQNTTVVKKKQTDNPKKNIPAKVICFISALCLWSIMITSINPIETRTINNIQVECINTESIVSTGKTYEILSGDSVSIKLRDRKDVLDYINPDDIIVTADFSKLSITNAISLEVDIPDYPDCEYTLLNPTMTISIEDIVTNEMDIVIETIGEESNDIYLADVSLNIKSLAVSGAKSVMDTVDKVVVQVDRSKISSSGAFSFTPIVIDKNGDIISNNKVKLSKDSITADIVVYNIKELPLNITPQLSSLILRGIVSNIEYSIDSVFVAAPDDVLEKYDELNITLLIEIALSEVKSDTYIRSIQLGEYIPDDLILMSNSSKLDIKLSFTKFYTKEIAFKSSDIILKNVDDKKEYTIQDKEYLVNIIGLSENIAEADLSIINPYIDAKNLSIGDNNVNISFESLGTNIFGDIQAVVSVANKE